MLAPSLSHTHGISIGAFNFLVLVLSLVLAVRAMEPVEEVAEAVKDLGQHSSASLLSIEELEWLDGLLKEPSPHPETQSIPFEGFEPAPFDFHNHFDSNSPSSHAVSHPFQSHEDKDLSPFPFAGVPDHQATGRQDSFRSGITTETSPGTPSAYFSSLTDTHQAPELVRFSDQVFTADPASSHQAMVTIQHMQDPQPPGKLGKLIQQENQQIHAPVASLSEERASKISSTSDLDGGEVVSHPDFVVHNNIPELREWIRSFTIPRNADLGLVLKEPKPLSFRSPYKGRHVRPIIRIAARNDLIDHITKVKLSQATLDFTKIADHMEPRAFLSTDKAATNVYFLADSASLKGDAAWIKADGSEGLTPEDIDKLVDGSVAIIERKKDGRGEFTYHVYGILSPAMFNSNWWKWGSKDIVSEKLS